MKNQLMIATVASAMILGGCATGQGMEYDKTATGALLGAVAGAAISKATGGEHVGRDAAIGAALGGGVGVYMDNQEKKLRQQMAGTGVQVNRDPQGNIDLVMPGNITFATDSTAINPSFFSTLDRLAATMVEYNQTTLDIAGHTDSDGDDAYNQNLSERRASAVADYLIRRGVSANRIRTYGYGESRPVATNSTESGKAQNRRVEIQINAPRSVS